MTTATPFADALELRPARDDDRAALERLAVLDSQAPPGSGPHLLAVAGDRPVAALALEGGWCAADPFARSAAALDLLWARRAQLCGPATRRASVTLVKRVRRGALAG